MKRHTTKTQRKHHAKRNERKNAKRAYIVAHREVKEKKRLVKRLARLKKQFDEMCYTPAD